MLNARWLPDARLGPVYRRIVELEQQKLDQARSDARDQAESDLRSAQLRYLAHLLRNRQTQPARETLDAWPESVRLSHAHQIAPLEIRLAAQSGTLDALLARYRSQPGTAPSNDVALPTARALQSIGDAASARRLLGFTYSRELEQYNFSATNFLGLAELRLEQGDVAGGMALLRRMNL
ncbi:MAG: hypothetical protein ACRD4U_11215, partial [Candidatus Acidiferrales bacterium]